MSSGRKDDTGGQGAKPSLQPKRRRRPPWGDLLGGKPIERQIWIFNKKIDRDEEELAEQQFQSMLLLKAHYGIVGGDYPYPPVGVATAEWLPWYQLSLRLASELDRSLEIVDAAPPSKTAARWRGVDGKVLLRLVDIQKKIHPNHSIRRCLKEIQKRNSGLSQYSLRELNARYHDAKRHIGTKKTPKQKLSS